MKQLERGIPEEAGIQSEAILKSIDHMEEDFTEPHSLMIMSHNQIVAEEVNTSFQDCLYCVALLFSL